MPFVGNVRVRRAVAVLALIVVGQLPAPRAPAQQAVVAEAPIAESEIEQRARLWANVPGKPYTHEQVIAELREEKRKIREAGQAGVEILDAEVDAEYARMARRMDISTAQLTANLAQEGVSPETIKHRLRADLAWQRYQKERQQAQ